MPLKGERLILETDISRTCPTATLRGVVLCNGTAGSGVVLGDSAGTCDLFASASGHIPAGVLLNDFVNVDQTKFHRNFHKEEAQVGNRATLLRKGRITTDQVSGTPTDGATAYLTANGQVTPTLSTTGGLVATPKVGQFRGILDESGFATIDVNLPVV